MKGSWLLGLLFLVGGAAGCMQAETWTVSPAITYSQSVGNNASHTNNLQYVLENACDNSTIYLAGGEYNASDNCALTVTQTNLTLSSEDVNSPAMFSCLGAALNTTGTGFVVRNLRFDSCLMGIVVASGDAQVVGCSFITNSIGVSVANAELQLEGGQFTMLAAQVGLDVSTSLVQIRDTAFSGGRGVAGAGVGSLTFVNATFSSTVAGAIVLGDSMELVVSNSNFANNQYTSGYGGAVQYINGSAAVSISSTAFTGSSAVQGGALYVTSYMTQTLSIVGCSFTANTASNGGAVYSNIPVVMQNTECTRNFATNGNGGCVYLESTSPALTLLGMGAGYTWSNNFASGNGGAVWAPLVSVEGVWFQNNTAANGGAIYSVTASLMGSTRFQDNTASRGGAMYAQEVTIVGVENLPLYYPWRTTVQFLTNTAQSSSAGGGAIYATGNVNISDALFDGNTAYQAGGALYVTGTSDLRGVFFLEHTAQYGGALYANGAANLVNSTFFTNTALTGGGVYALNNVVMSHINASNATATGSAERGGGLVFGLLKVTLTDSNVTTCGAATWGGVIFAEEEVAISRTTFRNSGAATGAVATADIIRVEDSLMLQSTGTYVLYGKDVTVTGSSLATGSQGAIWVLHTLRLNTSAVREFAAKAVVVDAAGANTYVENSMFTSNSGGAIEVGGKLMVSNSGFEVNTAPAGGAINANSNTSEISISTSTFDMNSALSGGAVHCNYDIPFTSERNAFTENNATSGGGGALLLVGVGNFSDMGSVFDGNMATDGGAIYFVPTAVVNITKTAEIMDTEFKNNRATRGGGLYWGHQLVTADYVLNMNMTSFTGNMAEEGAGLYATYSPYTLDNAIFTSNTAETNGGAIWSNANMTIQDSTITANMANTHGGCIYALEDFSMETTVASNNGARYGGCIYAGPDVDVTMNASHIQNNHATIRGGAYYQLRQWNLQTTYTDFLGNTAGLDPTEYFNAWYDVNTRRSVTRFTAHFVQWPEVVVGNEIIITLPSDYLLSECPYQNTTVVPYNLTVPNSSWNNDTQMWQDSNVTFDGYPYYLLDCNTTATITGNLPSAPEKTIVDTTAKTVTFQWPVGTNVTLVDDYVITMDYVKLPNHCNNATIGFETRHCYDVDVQGFGKYFQRLCDKRANDFTYSIPFWTDEYTGTPKGCSACDACYFLEHGEGLYECNHGGKTFFRDSVATGVCDATS